MSSPFLAQGGYDVTYSKAALTERNYLTVGGRTFTVPVFGLYAGYTNQVTLNLNFKTDLRDSDHQHHDRGVCGSDRHLRAADILKQRSSGSTLGFDFFYIKSELGYPVIVGYRRRSALDLSGTADAFSTALQEDEFVIGSPSSQ